MDPDSFFVSPKSSKIGWCGGSLLTRKFPAIKNSLRSSHVASLDKTANYWQSLDSD